MIRRSQAFALVCGAAMLAAGPSFAASTASTVATTGAAAPLAAGHAAVVNPRFQVVLRPELARLRDADDLRDAAAAAFGLEDLQLVRVPGVPVGAAALAVELVFDGVPAFVELGRDGVRAPGYRLLEDQSDGVLVERPAGPVNTFRGTVPGIDGARAAAGLESDGLHLMVLLADGRRVWLEPLARHVDGAPADFYALYEDADVAPHASMCGVVHDIIDPAVAGRAGDELDPTAGGGLCTAELACDADFQYFQDYGSVAAVEARINTIINTVNLQYEGQVGITHDITAIVVRSNSNDPYSSTNASTRLCEFITEWTNNQQSIQRDVAHLFTGAQLNGGTIGIASDIGGSGICVSQGSCSGGPFGPLGSYCLSQSDFNGNFSSATDLTAHELGHLWGAFHCSCPSFTMNPFITSANQFSGGTISSISNYRDTRSCLDCGGFPPANDSCADAAFIPANTSFVVDTTEATPAPGGSDSELPFGSPSCQWNGTSEDVHSTVWYRFFAADTSVRIETCASTDVQDTIVALYDGTCGNLIELACSEDECGESTYASTICFEGLIPGQSYLVLVGNPGSWAGSQPGLIDVSIQSPCPDIGPVAGACCLPDTSCVGVSFDECEALGGLWQGLGVTCADAGCSFIGGACCLPSGSCVAVTFESECDALGGIYLGLGSDCVDCGQFQGACCLSSGSCSQLTASLCETVGGTYLGDGTDCGDGGCAPACIGDFDGSGDVGFPDLLDLLALYGPCVDCPQDLDGDGQVGFGDIVNLLSSFGPCP